MSRVTMKELESVVGLLNGYAATIRKQGGSLPFEGDLEIARRGRVRLVEIVNPRRGERDIFVGQTLRDIHIYVSALLTVLGPMADKEAQP